MTRILPVVECLDYKHINTVLSGLAAWRMFASECVIIVPPGRAKSFYPALRDELGPNWSITPGFKVRGPYMDLWSPEAWRTRAREAIAAAWFLDCNDVYWECETIIADLWKDQLFDPASVRLGLMWLGSSGLISHWLALASSSRRTAELHAAMDAVSQNRYVFSECGRWGWHYDPAWARTIARLTAQLGDRLEWMLWPQSLGGIYELQPHAPGGDKEHYPRMYTPKEALMVANDLGGTVLMYPGLDKLGAAGEEMAVAYKLMEATSQIPTAEE